MIHRAENQAFCFISRQAADRGLDRRELALPPVGIYNNRCDSVRKLFANVRPARAPKHDPRDTDARVARDLNQMFDESFPAIGKQRFRRAHAAGFAGGEDRGDERPLRTACGKRHELALLGSCGVRERDGLVRQVLRVAADGNQVPP